ncbi:MAG: hypothetical protein MJZ05_00700 [Fibrobacter sp.]|nr:hypothetical protein [Fibrobacter sp.]
MRIVLFLFLVLGTVAFGRESISVIRPASSYVQLNMLAELRDDVYSADAGIAGEFAPCNCFAVYGDLSYRLVSYEWDTELHDQIHEMVNLQVNGFNEFYVGAKIFPVPYFGIDVSWRFPPVGGSKTNRFHRLGVSPFGLYPLSKRLTLGAAVEYYTFLEDDHFQAGDELGLKGSMTWKLAWNEKKKTGWQLDYVFLYRWRVQESENLNLDKLYQKMDDLYRGFRLRLDGTRYISIGTKSLGIALFYEMNRGNLFGVETGHSLGMYAKFLLG